MLGIWTKQPTGVIVPLLEVTLRASGKKLRFQNTSTGTLSESVEPGI